MALQIIGVLTILLALYMGQSNLPIAVALGVVGVCFLFPFPKEAPVVEEDANTTEDEVEDNSYLGIQKRTRETFNPNLGGELASTPQKYVLTDYSAFEDVGHRVKAYSAKKRRRRKKKNSLFNDIY